MSILVSIHAPTWGATSVCTLTRAETLFQSTHPHGVRQAVLGSSIGALNVSIHAPTWGATYIATPTKGSQGVSIHAPTWGATQTDAAVGVEHVFQSTHPHGVRQFNGAAPAVPIIVSIHAPTWGATQC